MLVILPFYKRETDDKGLALSHSAGKLHKQDSTSRLLNLMRNSRIQTIALPCANFDPAPLPTPVTARPHQNPRRSPTDDSGVQQGPEQLDGVSARARQAQRVGRLRSDLGPKPRGPGRGRGTRRDRGPPAQSRLLVARLLNCVRVIVVLEAVHGGGPLRNHPQASAQ